MATPTANSQGAKSGGGADDGGSSTAAAAAPPATGGFSLVPPKKDEVWSAWYKEQADTFEEFASFDPNAGVRPEGSVAALTRSMSARQVSGQFEEEVAQTWAEGWEDEDPEDTFDAIMGRIARYETSAAASARK